MPYYALATSPFIPPTDPFAPFKTKADKEILKRFIKGDRLVNWNYTCPVNWYLETKTGKNQVSLAGKDVAWGESPFSPDILRALLDIGSSAGTSDGIIAHSWAHRDGGKPGKEWFQYDDAKVQVKLKLHQEFQGIKAQWDAVDVPYAFNPSQLSPKALAFMRTMKKSWWAVAPVPEFHDALKELRLQGLLTLEADGLLRLTPEARAERIPKGPELVTIHKPTRKDLDRLARQAEAEARQQASC